MVKLSILAACALAIGAPAIAGDEAATVPAPDAAAPKPEKMVCKRERELGSNLTTKVCQTEAQWQAERTGSKESRKRPSE